MEKVFLRELLFMICFALVGYQLKAADKINVVDQKNTVVNYKDLISSGKLDANIYGLAAILTEMEANDVHSYDEVIKYFVAQGCDINEKLDIKKFMTEYGIKYGYATGKYLHKSQEEIQKLIQEAEQNLNSNILTRLFCYFNHGIMTYVSGAPANPYLIQALIQNRANVVNLGGILNFYRYAKDYELLDEGASCSCCVPINYKDTCLSISKYIYKNNSYINKAIMYSLISKKMYKKINE